MLDLSTNNVTKINSASSLILSGGNLSFLGNAATTPTQTFAGLTVKDSTSKITVTTGNATNSNVNVGAITRSGVGVLDVTLTPVGGGVASLLTTNTSVNGTLGGYITVANADFAKDNGAGKLIALASGDYSTTAAANSNFRLDATQNIGASVTVNSLKTNVATGTGNLTFTAGQTLTLASGGILANNTANIGTTAGQGTITSGNGTDLIFTGGNFVTTVNAVIANNGGTSIGVTVNKSAGGNVTLAATNTFSGPLTIHQGAVTLSSTTSLQNVTSIVLGTTGAGAGGGATAQTAGVNFNAAGVNNIAADFTLRPANGGQASINSTIGGQTLNLNGNIAIEAYDPALDLGNGNIFNQNLRQNTKVTIGGATVNAKTLSGNSTVNSNFIASFQTNGYGWAGNSLASGLTNLNNALVINSTITNGTGGGTLSLRFTSNSFGGATATPGLSLIALNGTNTFTGGGVDAANSSLPPGTVLENTIALLGDSSALGIGPVQFGRNTGAILPNDARAGVLTNASNLTIANNFNIASGSVNANGTQANPGGGSSMIGGNTATTSTYSGRISFGASNTSYFRGLGYTADNTFSSSTPFGSGSNYGSNPVLVLSQVAGGRTNVTGGIFRDGFGNSTTGNGQTHQVVIASGGEVKLSSALSDYSGRTIVRNGTLLVGGNVAAATDGPLGNSSQAILLGDTRTAFASSGGSVKAATVGALQGTATFNSVGGSNGNGLITWTAGFAAADVAFDGQTLAVNDFILIKDQAGAMITGASAVANNTSGSSTLNTLNNAAVNGIYKVTNIGATTATFERVADTIAYGTYVTVTAGNTWAGTRLYQSYGGPDQAVVLNDSPLNFNLDDTTYSPKLLTDGAVTVGRAVTVTAGVTGTSTLGGNSDDNSTFSGAIALNKALTLTSITTGTKATTISGVIADGAGSFALSKTGAGTVALTQATGNTYDGGTTISAGTLHITNTSGSATGTGAVTINGANAVLSGNGISTGTTTLTSGTIKPGPATITGSGPGDGIGTLTIGNLNADAGTIAMQLSTANGISDRLSITGTLKLNPLNTIAVTFTGGTYTETALDAWDLLDWGTLDNTAGFSAGINLRSGGTGGGQLDLPTLNAGYYWDVSSFLTTGAIVVVVPEPSRALLLFLGLTVAALRRRP